MFLQLAFISRRTPHFSSGVHDETLLRLVLFCLSIARGDIHDCHHSHGDGMSETRELMMNIESITSSSFSSLAFDFVLHD